MVIQEQGVVRKGVLLKNYRMESSRCRRRSRMWYQKDWFTGIDYYNLKEKQVHITEMEIKKPVETAVS